MSGMSRLLHALPCRPHLSHFLHLVRADVRTVREAKVEQDPLPLKVLTCPYIPRVVHELKGAADHADLILLFLGQLLVFLVLDVEVCSVNDGQPNPRGGQVEPGNGPAPSPGTGFALNTPIRRDTSTLHTLLLGTVSFARRDKE
jgi:hypothetical protein